jgi:cellobiose phosphorylase
MGRGAPRHLANAAGLSLELLLECRDLDEAELRRFFPSAWRHEERDGAELLSFFCGAHGHVVLRAKEARTQRPHGHIVRTGLGREVGLMNTHAHLRYAQMQAHVGDARGLLQSLALAHPVQLRERLPQASLRQANCYFSSSDLRVELS